MNRYEQDRHRTSREEDSRRRPESQHSQQWHGQHWRDDEGTSRFQQRGGGGDPTPDYGDNDPRFLPQYGDHNSRSYYGNLPPRRGPGARPSSPNFGGSFGTSEPRREYDRAHGRSYDARWDDDDAEFFGSAARSTRESSSRGHDAEHGRFGGSEGSAGTRRDQAGPRSHSSPYGYDSNQGQFYSDSIAFHGPHSGRGPKGYKRSDEHIIDDVSRRLEHHGHVDASEIEVTCKDGIVTLKGKVEDRRAKRESEQCAEGVHGVKDVMNELKVEGGFFSKLFGGGEDHSSASTSAQSGAQSANKGPQ